MIKISDFFVKLFVFITVIYGLIQVSYQSTVFADTLALCCETNSCIGHNCSDSSSMYHKNYSCSEEVTLTCQDCMIATGNKLLCNIDYTWYTYCNLPNGHRYSSYYGEEIPLTSAGISGDPYYPIGGHGTYTVTHTGGVSTIQYQWYYKYQLGAGPILPNLPTPGYWNPIGNHNTTVILSFQQDFLLKCEVKDIYTTVTSNILSIHVGYGSIALQNNGTMNNEELNFSTQKENIPTYFILEQNYPNPFNPSTIIKYSVATAGYVSIRIYDASGKEVTQLVNEEKTPGNYSVIFNTNSIPEGLSSGIYIYKMTTNNFQASKKMIVLK